jgi:hypothetical protein
MNVTPHLPHAPLAALERLARALGIDAECYPCECALRGWACHCAAEYRARLVAAVGEALRRAG